MFENPTATLALLSEGVAQDVGGVVERQLTADERVDRVALVRRGGGDDRVEDRAPIADLGRGAYSWCDYIDCAVGLQPCASVNEFVGAGHPLGHLDTVRWWRAECRLARRDAVAAAVRGNVSDSVVPYLRGACAAGR